MKNFQPRIEAKTPWGPVSVSQSQAVDLLWVHPKTAQRWAHGRQRISREHAMLLGILSGQVVPFPRWEGFSFVEQVGPAPNRARFAVLVSPCGRRWVPDDLRRFYPVSGAL